MILRIAWLLLFVGLAPVCVVGQGTFRVRFEQPNYAVQPGGSLAVNVVIDPAPAAGLFSYGVLVSFDPSHAVAQLLGISPVPELDFNGPLGPGALTAVTDGSAGVKGTVNFATGQPYAGSLLATFVLKDRGSAAGTTYPLSLSFYRTLGPSETLFVDGNGQPLDAQISFGSAVVNVVPEPSVSLLLLMGGMWGVWTNLRSRGEVSTLSLAV